MQVKLSKRGFGVCLEQYNKSSEYYCSQLIGDREQQQEVRRIGESAHSARLTNGEKCSCSVFVAYRVQCRHLFAFHNREFKLHLVDAKFYAQPLSVSTPNPEYTNVLSTWCATRDPYVGSLCDKLLVGQHQSAVPCGPPRRPSTILQLTGELDGSGGDDGELDDDHHDDHDADPSQQVYVAGDLPQDYQSMVGEGNTQPNHESLEQQVCVVVNKSRTSSAVGIKDRNVTYADFTSIANSITNLVLGLPTEVAKKECLGCLVEMKNALSLSATNGHYASVPLMGFMSHAQKFVRAFGPNANSRRE